MQKNCFNYPIEFVQDIFGESTVLADTLKKVTGAENPTILIVADYNVVQHVEDLGKKIGRYVQEHGIQIAGPAVVMPGGEKIKSDNLQSAMKVVEAILSARLGCNDVVLAIGGGAILDIAGYAAAQVRGGVKLVRMPTTPAAMMGAAFTDYAAVDVATVKDALRVPSHPDAVLIDVTFAASVLDGVWRGGIAEAIRLGLAYSAPLVRLVMECADAYRTRDLAILDEIVQTAYKVRMKKGGTSLGAWAAARLESMSGYKLPYGYALTIGVCLDMIYAVERGTFPADDCEKVMFGLDACGSLDGRTHSGHLLSQPDALLLGLDAWSLSTGTMELTILNGIGKSKLEAEPDREAYRTAIKKLLPSSPMKP